MIQKQYKSGFTVNGREPYMTEDWLFSKEHSSDKKLVFQGYDANMCPMRDFSKRPKSGWNQKVINNALEFTQDFDGEVWLDDVRIK